MNFRAKFTHAGTADLSLAQLGSLREKAAELVVATGTDIVLDGANYAYHVWESTDDPFNSDGDIIDYQTAILQYETGASLAFHTNLNTPDEHRRFCVIGTHGMAEGDFVRGFLKVTARDGRRVEPVRCGRARRCLRRRSSQRLDHRPAHGGLRGWSRRGVDSRPPLERQRRDGNWWSRRTPARHARRR